MMLPFALLMTILIVCCAVLPLKLKTHIKLLLVLPVMAMTAKFEIIRLFGGPMFFAPDLPGWFLQILTWLHVTAFFWIFILLASTLVRLAAWSVFKFRKRDFPAIWSTSLNYFNWASLLLAMAFTASGMYYAGELPQIKHVELHFAALPAEAENCRIALLADLHIDRASDPEKIRKIVDMTNDLQCDLVVLAGDIVDGRVTELGSNVALLGKLCAPLGVYGIMGNHEYFSGGMVWKDFLNDLGIKMLLNEHVRLGNAVSLAGITDPAARRLRIPGAMPDIAKTLQGVDPGKFVILLAHRPGGAAQAAAAGVDLQLSGHTHGGMVRGFDQIVARYNNGLVSGLYQLNDMQLYISNGTGIWSGFPVRLGRRSEITVITLKGNKN